MKKYRMRKSILTIGILMVLCSIVPLLLFSVIVNQNMLRTLQANMTINYQKTIDELALSLSMNIQPFIDLLQYDTRRTDVVKLFSDVSNGKKEFQAKELQQKLQDRETAVRVLPNCRAAWSEWERRGKMPTRGFLNLRRTFRLSAAFRLRKLCTRERGAFTSRTITAGLTFTTGLCL